MIKRCWLAVAGENDQEMPQSYSADQPTATLGEKVQNTNNHMIPNSNKSKATWHQVYKTLFMLSLAEHEIYPAHKC